jgi:hypothetical protein
MPLHIIRFFGILLGSISALACSGLNREGPSVSCQDLQGGRVNACKSGIIASCKDGKTVTYEVCTDGSDAENVCEASWQKAGAYQCSQSTSSGSSGSCMPATNSACAACLQSGCPTQYSACVNDAVCGQQCTGPLAADLAPCLQQCEGGPSPQCSVVSGHIQ